MFSSEKRKLMLKKINKNKRLKNEPDGVSSNEEPINKGVEKVCEPGPSIDIQDEFCENAEKIDENNSFTKVSNLELACF